MLTHGELRAEVDRLAGAVAGSGAGSHRSHRHRGPQRSRDGHRLPGRGLHRLRRAAQPQVPHRRAALLPRGSGRQGAHDPSRRVGLGRSRRGPSRRCWGAAGGTDRLGCRRPQLDRPARILSCRRAVHPERAVRRGRGSGPAHLRHHVATQDRAASPTEPGPLGCRHRPVTGLDRRRQVAAGDAPVPYSRAVGRAAGSAVGRSLGGLHRGVRRLPVLRSALRAASHLLHRGADHAPDGAGPLVAPSRCSPGRRFAVRALVLGVAARAGAARAAGAVRLACDRGLRHDRGHPPDVRQPAAAGGGQAAVGGSRHRHRAGRARRRGPRPRALRARARCPSRVRP